MKDVKHYLVIAVVVLAVLYIVNRVDFLKKFVTA